VNSLQDESIDPQEPTAESADAPDDLRSDDAVNTDSSPEEAEVKEEAPAEEAEVKEEAPAEEAEVKEEDIPFDPNNIPKKYDSDVFEWYILKVQVNREKGICETLLRQVKRQGLEEYFEEVVVPTEDVAEFNRNGKRRVVKRKLFPGYIMVKMKLVDEAWFLVRETQGIGDFTGTLGKPSPMPADEVARILKTTNEENEDGEEGQVKTAIPFNPGDRVRVKDGNFQNFDYQYFW
jgi:transcriptional antiterminator NusG